MSDDSKNISRRMFVGGVAAGAGAVLLSSPIERMLDMMVRGLIQKAQADEGGTEGSRNYVNLLLYGAPFRYGFDHWVRTNASDPAMLSNPMISTRLLATGGRVVSAQYSTFAAANGTLVPHIFSNQVYRGDGSRRPLSDLLDSMLVIRGYGTNIDGHSTNSVIQLAPLGGASSIAGLASDYSNKTFEAIQWPDRTSLSKFFSANGKAMNKLSGANPLQNLMEGFSAPSRGLKGRAVMDRNREAIDLARARLQAYARSDNPGAAVLAKNMDNAVSQMRKGVAGIDAFWASALPRYQGIVRNCLRDMNVPGIMDAPIVGDGTLTFGLQTDDIDRLGRNADFREAFQNWEIPAYLAEGFALTEYVLSQGLATTIELLTYDMGTLTMSLAKRSDHSVDEVQRKNLQHDMHAAGSVTVTATTNAYFRAIGGCLLELRDKLSATTLNGKNVWEETVFQISSDFGRAPRSDGTGSDHGYNQMVTSVFSGIIKNGPLVIGNVRQTGLATNYEGTMGMAAAIDGYNQSGPPTPMMPASCVAAMLRVPKNPFENVAAPLLVVENGRVRILTPGKMVAA